MSSKLLILLKKYAPELGITGGLVVVVVVMALLPSCKTLDHVDIHFDATPDPVLTPKE